MATYKIRTETVTEPKTGGFYKDNDGDVFVYLGGPYPGDPWLQIEDIGAYTRSASYPAEPLLELTPEEYSTAIRELRA